MLQDGDHIVKKSGEKGKNFPERACQSGSASGCRIVFDFH